MKFVYPNHIGHVTTRYRFDLSAYARSSDSSRPARPAHSPSPALSRISQLPVNKALVRASRAVTPTNTNSRSNASISRTPSNANARSLGSACASACKRRPRRELDPRSLVLHPLRLAHEGLLALLERHPARNPLRARPAHLHILEVQQSPIQPLHLHRQRRSGRLSAAAAASAAAFASRASFSRAASRTLPSTVATPTSSPPRSSDDRPASRDARSARSRCCAPSASA